MTLERYNENSHLGVLRYITDRSSIVIQVFESNFCHLKSRDKNEFLPKVSAFIAMQNSVIRGFRAKRELI